MTSRFLLYIKTVAVLFLLNLTACNKSLDLHPQDNLEDEQVFNNLNNFEAAVLGVYSGLEYEHTILVGGAMADELRLDPDNSGVNSFATNFYRWTYSSDDDVMYNAWKCGYESIYRINLLLENINRVPTSTEADKRKVTQLKAELLGLRSFIHFGVYQIFGKYDSNQQGTAIPYVTTVNLNAKPSRVSIEEFYTLAWSDLKAALASDVLPTVDYRMNRDALNAFAARLLLYKKDYAEAAKYAELAIQNHSLSPADQYEGIWKDKENKEVIFRLKRNQANELKPNNLWFNYSAGKILFHPSYKITDYALAGDGIRKELFEESEMEEDDDDNFVSIKKYPGNGYASNINDVKVFRSAEMYLILAEALLKDNPAAAKTAINTLRQAREAGEYNHAINLQDILNERYIELAFEGHRYFDFKRLSLTIERLPMDLSIKEDKKDLSPFDPAYQIPIPFKETQANPNLK